MKKLLNQISSTIIQYREMPDKLTFDDAEVLQGLMKNLSADLFFLEKDRDDISRLFYSTIHNLIKDGGSATGAEKEAKHKHPEKRYMDRLISAGYKTLDAMRSNQSFLKKEK